MTHNARTGRFPHDPSGSVRFRRLEDDQVDQNAPLTSSFARGGDAGPVPGRALDPAASEPAPKDGDMPLIMPASRSIAAEDISRIGVEGTPGDARSGPGLLRLELVALVLILSSVAVGAAAWLGWAAGLAVLGWFALAIVFNPVFWATILRIKDRRRATHEERAKTITVRPYQVTGNDNRNEQRAAAH